MYPFFLGEIDYVRNCAQQLPSYVHSASCNLYRLRTEPPGKASDAVPDCGGNSEELNSSERNLLIQSEWVGRYKSSQMAKKQREDPHIGTILRYLERSGERPNRDKIAFESPAVRNLWLLWPLLEISLGVLYKRLLRNDGRVDYQLSVTYGTCTACY